MLPLPLLTADSSMRPSKRQLCAGSERRPYDAQAVLNATGHAQAAQPRSCCLRLSCTWCSLVQLGAAARMHCSARRAGYPSDSSRAERQQLRTRLAGGGPLHYDYAVDQLRHLRHRSRLLCGRAVPPVCSARRRPGRETTATAPGRRRGPGRGAPPSPLLGRRSGPGRGAPPGTTQPRAENPPPSPHPVAAASRGRCRPDRSPGGAQRATDSPHGPLTPRIASKRSPRMSFTVWARGTVATGTRSMGRARRAGRWSNSDQASGDHPRSSGREPSQSGRRWGTDGPAASTSRRIRARGPGPGDSDYASAGVVGRVPRAAGAGPQPGTPSVKVPHWPSCVSKAVGRARASWKRAPHLSPAV